MRVLDAIPGAATFTALLALQCGRIDTQVGSESARSQGAGVTTENRGGGGSGPGTSEPDDPEIGGGDASTGQTGGNQDAGMDAEAPPTTDAEAGSPIDPDAPDQLGGLELWLDAQVLNEGPLEEWIDLSPNQHVFDGADHAPVATPGALGGETAVRFDGTSQYMITNTLPDFVSYDIFIVIQSPIEAPTFVVTTVLKHHDNFEINHGHIVPSNAPSASSVLTGDSTWHSAAFTYPEVEVPYVWNITYDHENEDLISYTNGELSVFNSALSGEPRSTPNTPTHLGGKPEFSDRYFTGDIGEIVVYNRHLSDSERAQITDYLSERWNF